MESLKSESAGSQEQVTGRNRGSRSVFCCCWLDSRRSRAAGSSSRWARGRLAASCTGGSRAAAAGPLVRGQAAAASSSWARAPEQAMRCSLRATGQAACSRGGAAEAAEACRDRGVDAHAQSADGAEGGMATEPSARRVACLRASRDGSGNWESGLRSRVARKLGLRVVRAGLKGNGNEIRIFHLPRRDSETLNYGTHLSYRIPNG
jgi:hypothetical protein